MSHIYLCVYGHFYQPPRENPFTGEIPKEVGAEPFSNFNEKIAAECYAPNAEAGNFSAISYDLGPTLAAWLQRQHPKVYQRIIDSDRIHQQRYGMGNALAQAYNHTILPLASTRDKRTQIAWGLQDFRHRYKRSAQGMWLAETAIDLESLDQLAQAGIRYTVLAPWQADAAYPIDTTEPYIVSLPSGRTITAFFYHNSSGGVSFHENLTSNADHFAQHELLRHLNAEKRGRGIPQLITLASDGELYGHHQPWRDMFLSYLLSHAAPSVGIEVCTLERYLNMYPPTREIGLRVPSSWSCPEHGVARWSTGCSCTKGDSRWKPALRQALTNLAERGNALFEQHAGATLADPWAARDAYLALRNNWESEEQFWEQYGKRHQPPADTRLKTRTHLLLEAQYYHQYSFTSCAFFFEDLDRIEPRNALAFARRAISLTWLATGVDLQHSFLQDLRAAKSGNSSVTGFDLYLQLPTVAEHLLPPQQ